MLSANEVRAEEGWPASTDPTADLIAPPVMGGARAAGAEGDEQPTPSTLAGDDEADKIARLDLGLTLASDEWVIEHVTDISAVLWTLSQARARSQRRELAAWSPLVADSGDPAQSRRGQQHARRLKMTPA